MGMIATVMDPAQMSMDPTCVCVTLAIQEMERTVQISMSAPPKRITAI